MLNTARPRPPAPPPLPPGALHGLYAWLDALPLSRRKRHLARDFSDGVMLAEVVKLFRPRLVDLHNYVPTCNTGQKRSNWNVLNRKVFHKLGLSVSEEEIRKVVVNTPGAIEPILCAVRDKVEAGEDPPGTAGHKRSGPGCAAASREHVPLPICDGETPAGLRTRIGSVPPGGLMAQRWSPLQEAGRSSGDAVAQPGSPGTTWTLGCHSGCWRKRSRRWQSCRRPSRYRPGRPSKQLGPACGEVGAARQGP
ncbi:uncharacterized protein LOC122708718 isoform X4 [Cervus elaphus]|uniref:uncharacterized protein LOC122708718 isoform X4 n=1 Tax=Cervus elaphus TaxID=9860 RepID=UPI001CC307DD|nr:uncharacterized protein LOC122708718 isoform X4 [Cervus elaphus]